MDQPTTEHSAEVLERTLDHCLRSAKLIQVYAPDESASGLWTVVLLEGKAGPVFIGTGMTRTDAAVAAHLEGNRQGELEFSSSDETTSAEDDEAPKDTDGTAEEDVI